MSKRSFEEFSTTASSSRYHSVLDHAESLLQAAKALKQDLERLGNCDGSPTHEKILVTLKQHNARILPVAQALSQDETGSVSPALCTTHKTQKVDEHRGPSSGHSQSGLSIPHPTLLTKWIPQDVPDNANMLSPLPPILDPVLEKAARTHSGIAKSIGEMDYERLEWIGDAYLYLVSSALIYQTFPTLPTGRCSQLRERLIKNEALSGFTLRYNLDKRARMPSEYQPGGRPSQTGAGTSASSKERKKILGDLLEAHMAAAILGDTDGLSRVIAWLKPAWGTILKREINDEHKKSILLGSSNPAGGRGHPGSSSLVPPPPKVILSQAIGAAGVNISYQDVGDHKKDKNSGLPWFTVAVYYNGLGETDLSLGYGGGLSKKEAGNNAALKVLENKKLIKRLQRLRDAVGAAPPNADNPPVK